MFIIRQNDLSLTPLRRCKRGWNGLPAAGPLLVGVLLLGGLSGCRSEHNEQVEFMQSDLYKGMRPVKVDMMDSNQPSVGATVDVTSGRPIAQAPHTRLDIGKVPIPHVVSAEIVMESPNDLKEEGERTRGWTGVFDIYWKLNWARKELLDDNVPKDLAEVVVRTRKHSARIASEGVHAFFEADIQKFLDPADAALKHLQEGLTHMEARTSLENAHIVWRTLPWNGSSAEMRRVLESMHVLPVSERAMGQSFSSFKNRTDDDDETSSRPSAKFVAARPYISSTQQDAAAMILHYTEKYHESPEVCAHKEFESALKEIVRMRNLLELRYTPPSVPGDNTLIVGELRQEPGGMLARPDHFLPVATETSAAPSDTSR